MLYLLIYLFVFLICSIVFIIKELQDEAFPAEDIDNNIILFGILFGLLWPITLPIFIIFKFLKWLCQQILKIIENENE
jgi:hypothetical protein